MDRNVSRLFGLKKYPLEWVSALDPENQKILDKLADRMSTYYSSRSEYYSDISNSEDLWNEKSYLPYQSILEHAFNASSILEIGCGRSSVLRWFPGLQSKYTGIDFSDSLMLDNRNDHPKAKFVPISNPKRYSLPDAHYDLIFSVFVLEHAVYPHIFLEECYRMLAPGGTVIILTPNYLDHGWMASQQVSEGLASGRELLKAGKLVSAFRALIYNKIYIPHICERMSNKLPGFYVNLNPICFEVTSFRPDVDAVYVTSEKEISNYLVGLGLILDQLDQETQKFISDRKLCFLSAKKMI